MLLATTADMKEMDHKMAKVYSSTKLMQQAAQVVFDCICERFSKGQKILIVCGNGNNGGDGYALAYLAKDIYIVEILALYPPQTPDAHEFYQRIKNEVPIHTKCDVHQYDILVDALFGTGLHSAITGEHKRLIESMNQAPSYRIAIDIPSGIHADTGEILNACVNADLVVTFQFAKRGLYLYPGHIFCKEILVKDIGIYEQFQYIKNPIQILNHELIGKQFPHRKPHSHKGTYGKVLMIGGSASMHGAITLAGDSALHSGIGTLTMFIPSDIRDVVAHKLTEAMLLNAPCKDGYFDKEAITLLKQKINDYDVVMIGCGMGRNLVNEELLRVVLTSDKPCVIDGDALFLLPSCCEHLKRDAPIILTPHLKEFSYFSKFNMDEILKYPISCGQDFIKEFPMVTLVLKDEFTLIFYQENIYMNIRGCDALAKGGSGDVLCGLITSFLAQGKHPLYAANSGVYVHALSGENSAKLHSSYSTLPHELRDSFDSIFQELTSDTKKD